MTTNIAFESLTSFGRELFRASGMDEEKAATVARLLVLGDMMGRQTHGMALAPLYLDQLEKKMMQPTGEQVCIKDTGSTVLWEGNYLPGLWLVDEALKLAFGRVAKAWRRNDRHPTQSPHCVPRSIGQAGHGSRLYGNPRQLGSFGTIRRSVWRQGTHDDPQSIRDRLSRHQDAGPR